MRRDLAWDGCVNVRDLGGFTTATGTTAFGRLVRADNARNLTDAGWNAAADYGIRTILDLRAEFECATDPPSRQEFLHYRVSLFHHFDDDPEYRADLLERIARLDRAARYATLYAEALRLDSRQIARAVEILADAEGAALFHCVGGKDRTGLLTAILLRHVGVPLDEIEDDYMRTEVLARAAGPATDAHDVSAPRGAIGPVLDGVEVEHGSLEAYLKDAGVSTDRLDRLRAKLA